MKEYTNGNKQISELLDMALTTSLVDLDAFSQTMPPSMAVQVSSALDVYAQKIMRKANYLGARGNNCDHNKAVNIQNKRLVKIRKAMGYSYPNIGEVKF